MAANAGHPGPVSQATYWKRRVFVLAGVLIVVALLAWACTGSGGDDTADDDSSGPVQADTSRDPEAEDSTPTDGEPTPEPSPDGEDEHGEDESGGSAAADEADGDSGGSGGGGADIPAPRRAEDPCRPADVVVTLETDEESYTSGQEPEIEVTLVNTGDQTCTVDVAGEHLELRITSGQDRIFSTADCADDETEERQLEQGRVFTTTLTWDRTRSWSDCRDEQRNAGSGWYVVRLHSLYDQGAEPQPFQLR